MTPSDDETRLRPADDATAFTPAAGETRPADSSARPAVTTQSFQAGDAFGSRYRILKELGAGGMGVVYQAWDEVLNVVVALKVIRPDTVSDPVSAREIERRFKRELLLARQVTHKNVVRIHDLGDVDGTKYITMSFVEGDDLSTTLKRDGKLRVARVVRLARQVASGLEAAHDAGVVHRDLKPANIMVDTDGEALIMDFGIALSAGPDPRARLTPAALASTGPSAETMIGSASGATTMGSSRVAGAIIGTLEYMSPEQSKGEPVDHRSDIYTFGLILTDLLLGPRVAVPGATPWESLTDRIKHAPMPLAARHPEVPAGFDDVIMKCLQLNPADRFQTTNDLVRALDRLDDEGNLIPEPRRFTPRMIAMASMLLVALLGGTWWLSKLNQPAAPQEPVSVLVADFVNAANDPVFNGLVEPALMVGIEGAAFIEAYPRRDAMRLAGTIKKDAPLDDAMARLVSLREGVDVVVGGNISRDGDGYALHVKAIRPSADKDEVILDWSTTAESKDKVLDAVAQIAARVRQTLGDTKGDSAAKDAETFTAASLEAAKAYGEAQALQWAGRVDDAIAAYERTVQLDPNLGRAHAGKAALYANQGRSQEAEASYQAALGMLDRMTEREKFRTRGSYYLFKLNGESAMKEFETLVAQYPADTSGLANLAVAHFYRRDMKSARDVGKRASDAYPQNIVRKNNAALYAMYAGDFEEAARIANEVLKLNPEYVKGFVALGVSQLALGQPAEAAATFTRLSQLASTTAKSFASAGLIDVALFEGRQQDALTLLDAAVAADRAAGSKSQLGRRLAIRAGVLAARGNRPAAIRDAEEAVASGSEHGILFMAGRAFIDAGQSARALALATDLDNRLEDEPRVYGALLRGEVSLAAGRARDALTKFEEAQKVKDTWMGRYDLGRAYVALKAFPQASDELDRSASRRGEATAVFLDDQPSYRLVAGLDAYVRQAKQGLGGAGR